MNAVLEPGEGDESRQAPVRSGTTHADEQTDDRSPHNEVRQDGHRRTVSKATSPIPAGHLASVMTLFLIVGWTITWLVWSALLSRGPAGNLPPTVVAWLAAGVVPVSLLVLVAAGEHFASKRRDLQAVQLQVAYHAERVQALTEALSCQAERDKQLQALFTEICERERMLTTELGRIREHLDHQSETVWNSRMIP
jgi:hypothetical protein